MTKTGSEKHSTESEKLQAPVTLRTRAAEMAVTSEGLRLLPRLAMKWSNMVANRERWDGSERDRKAVEESAVEALVSLLGQTAANLADSFGFERLLEVSICWGEEESDSWAARLMPWEYLISSATRSVRKGSRLIVVRHLDVGKQPRSKTASKSRRGTGLVPPRGHQTPREGIVLCCVPPVIGPTLQKSLIEESRMVDNVWRKLDLDDPQQVSNPDRAGFESAVARGADWIHFLGVNGANAASELKDSVLIAGNSKEEFEGISAEEIHELILRSETKPSLAVFNFCHSAARLASSAVAGGAAAAIGFQDVVSDQTCMDVVGTFYPALQRRNGNLLAAFLDLWSGMEASLCGTVIVLWSATSLLDEKLEVEATGPAPGRRAAAPGRRAAAAAAPAPIIYGIPDPLEVCIEPVPAVNFSLLHNGRSLFHKLEIGKVSDQPMKDVLIEVTVNDGGQTSSWRSLRTFNRLGVCIAKDVQLSFISSMVRSLRESLVTSLQVTITADGRLCCSQSARIRLLAIDEWVDDDDNRCWLPSFVHPRDSAAAGIITRAEGYLQALCDDFGAGFDGYQASGEMVELQIRALWVAISRDCEIRYINPPPTYTKSSQRLRRPCEMVATRQGTCLDLALLVCACVEWVGVYPVIFLISGHAFPGYWRSEKDFRDFYDPENVSTAQPSQPILAREQQSSGDPGLQRRWMTGKDRSAEILREVQAGRLVPIESVWLTNGRSFSDAIKAGCHNLYTPGAFEYLIDVQRAREHDITPLPLPESP